MTGIIIYMSGRFSFVCKFRYLTADLSMHLNHVLTQRVFFSFLLALQALFSRSFKKLLQEHSHIYCPTFMIIVWDKGKVIAFMHYSNVMCPKKIKIDLET